MEPELIQLLLQVGGAPAAVIIAIGLSFKYVVNGKLEDIGSKVDTGFERMSTEFKEVNEALHDHDKRITILEHDEEYTA